MRTRMGLIESSLAVVALAILAADNAPAMTLVRDGTGQAVLVTVAEPEEAEAKAAAEIQEHVRKMSGAELPIVVVGSAPAGQTRIFIGAAADASLDAAIRQEGTDPGSFALVVGEDAVHVRGLSPDGTYYAACELLEQLGIRWFMPGDIGTVIPARETVELSEQRTIRVPSFEGRWEGGFASKSPIWQKRMRMGGPFFPSAHGVKLPKDCDFKTHPEYYALIDGERRKKQLCVSNPEVIKAAVHVLKEYFRKSPDSLWKGIGPNDGRGFCECPDCKALDGGDWDPFAAHMSMTDRYVWFFNQLLAGIEDEFPDKKLCFYSYASYNRPPLKFKPDPRIVPAFAPITLCRVHGLGNPICPEKDKYYRWLVQEWGRILPNVYDRGYWFNLADPGLLFPMVHRLRTQIPISHELGITGWRVETLTHWASETPSLYIAAKLMWNHKSDVDALMGDFYDSFFGPAASPMGHYFELINTALRDADVHTGCSFDMPHFYPESLRKQATALFADAVAASGDTVYGQRVGIFRQAFEYTEAFIDMLERRTKHDWKGAQEALDRIDTLREKLASYEREMITKRYALSYLKRFFRPCTEQGYERAVTKGKLVAGLPDEWEFALDTENVGEPLQWYSKDLTGGNWRPMKTSSLSWSDQGLRYYKGVGWYRARVAIPADAKDKELFLWFGGVDEKAKVWVNGQPLGESPGRAFVPFEMDASAAVRADGENLVVVRIDNSNLNEVGTGGITAPVMFWTPMESTHQAEQGGEDVTPVEFK